MKQMENVNKTSKIHIEISAKNWNCLRLRNNGTSSVWCCCNIFISSHHRLRKSLLTAIVIAIITILYILYIWGGVSAIEIRH